MAVNLAVGWQLVHLTDRVIELRKDDYSYRRFTGRDGYVKVRGEPGMSRDALMTKAIQLAEQTDAALGLRVAEWLMPSAVALAKFKRQQKKLAPVFGVPGQEPDMKVYRP